MVYDIKPNKMYYVIPLLILLIGGNFFYLLINNSIQSFSHLMDTLNPEESIIITVGENDKFYIMVDDFNRDDISIFSIDDSTTMQIYSDNSNYLFDLHIYEEGNSSNVVIAKKLPDNTSITFNDYYVIMTAEFKDAGTYVISVTSEQAVYPPFSIGLTNKNIGLMILSIFISIGVFIGTILGTVFTYLKIHEKRMKAINDFEQSTYRASDYPNY